MIKLDPQDRWFDQKPSQKPRRYSLFMIGVLFVVVAACGGFYYWYAFLQSSNYSQVYHQIGIARMPSGLEFQPAVRSRLDQLSHEPCYRDAIIDLADSMLEAGYPRDANTVLTNFSKRCGESDDLLVRRYKSMLMASDFSAAAHIADGLVGAHPADASIRYWRGNAYEELKDYPHALADYISAIQLTGKPETISIDNYYDISRMYAALNRYCDAITPIETFISFDPVARRTTQSTRLIAEYASKGNCDVHYASGSAIVSRLPSYGAPGANTLVAVINGTPGNFLLDTGATFVAVTPDFASKARLKIETDTQFPIKTVGGIASADLGYAKTVSVGKAEAQGVAVAVVRGAADPFGGQLDGLLGMSFLARFTVSLSQNTVQLTAIPIR